MSGSRSRRKGAQAERDLAKRFAEAMPGTDCKRGIGQARRGSEVADVEVPYFFVESKHGKRPNPRAAYAQAVEAANENGSGKTPIAVIRDDRKEPFVVIGLDDFLRFVGEWWLWHPSHDARIKRFLEDSEIARPGLTARLERLAMGRTVGEREPDRIKANVLSDGHGNEWATCGAGCELEIVRPGKVQCGKCEDAEAKCAAVTVDDERDQGV